MMKLKVGQAVKEVANEKGTHGGWGCWHLSGHSCPRSPGI